ncbi:MAG: hypothetical protein CO072_02015, partial [Candidatus Huberarchaeum crystalense]
VFFRNFTTELCSNQQICFITYKYNLKVYLDDQELGVVPENKTFCFATTDSSHKLMLASATYVENTSFFVNICQKQQQNKSCFCGDKVCDTGCRENYKTCPIDCKPSPSNKLKISAPQDTEQGKIFSIIITDNDNQAIENAKVIYGNQTKTTDKNGKATFIADLNYHKITATKDDYDVASAQINIIKTIPLPQPCELFGFNFGKFIFCGYWWLLLILMLGVGYYVYKNYYKNYENQK